MKDQQLSLMMYASTGCEAKSLLEDLLARPSAHILRARCGMLRCCPPARHSRQLPPFSFFLSVLSGHPDRSLMLEKIGFAW